MRKAIVKDEVFIPKQEFIYSPRLKTFCGVIVEVYYRPDQDSDHPWSLADSTHSYCFKEEELIFL